MSRLFICIAGFLYLSCIAVNQATAEATDPATGLIIADGWELASAHCGACHSHKLVTAQRGDQLFWRSTIRWMQKTQNLWQIPIDTETQLIDYLATNYNEVDWGRRPNLPVSLMPGLGGNKEAHQQPAL